MPDPPSQEDREFLGCVSRAFEIFNTDLTHKRSKRIQVGAAQSEAFRGLDELVAVTRAAHRKCYEARSPTSTQLGKCLQALDRHAPVIDVMIQQQPFFVNVIWGGIRCIVQAAAGECRAGPEIAAGLEDVLSRIPQLQLELRNHAGNARVAEATSAVLARIICFLVNAKRFVLRSAPGRTFRAQGLRLFETLRDVARWDEARAREIRASSDTVQIRLLQQTNAEIVTQTAFRDAERDFMSQTHSTLLTLDWDVRALSEMLSNSPPYHLESEAQSFSQLQKRIHSWLCQGATVADVTTTREPGTCDWVFQQAEYKRWENSGFKNFLCIQGATGTGKSVLASRLLQQAPKDTVRLKKCFRSSRRREPFAATTGLAITLLASLLNNIKINKDKRVPDVFKHLLRLTQQSDAAVECPEVNLLSALDKLIDLTPDFILVVDALEECIDTQNCDTEDYYRLLGYLRKLSSLPKARVILLARPGVFLGKEFENSPCISINSDLLRPDLVRFVEQEIERREQRKPCLWKRKSQIVDEIIDCCQGNFLWAKLIMEELKTVPNSNEIKRRLSNFPMAFTEQYLRELENVNSTLRASDRALRDSIFLLLLGAYEPLSITQMTNILALNTESNSIDEGELLEDAGAEILRLCRPLIELVGDDHIQFVHEGAREAVVKFTCNWREDANALLARKCLSKLIQTEYRDWKCAAKVLRHNLLPGDIIERFSGQPRDKELRLWFKESVPYDYAVLHWQEHVTALKEPSEDIINKLVQFLTGNEFVTWSEVLFQLKPNAGIGSQIQVRAVLLAWYDKLPNAIKERIPIKQFFVKAHESLSSEFVAKGQDKILPYLPLVRLGQYFNVGGLTTEDFQKAYKYKMTVVVGYEEALGPRNPLTLRAKTEVFKEFFYQKRFDEAAKGLRDIEKIQREVIGKDKIDYCFTLQLLGLAEYSVTEFENAITTWKRAVDGFRKLCGDDAFLTLQTEMGIGQALERTPRLEESYDVYQHILRIWDPIGGPMHPFTLMLRTSLGSVCRKLRRFDEAEKALLQSLGYRQHLSATTSPEDPALIDSVLQVAALYYDMGRGKEGIDYLNLLNDSVNLQNEFERQCMKVHITALIDLDSDFYGRAKAALQRILDKGSGEDLENNNRELLWVRITLADVLREREREDEALMLFMGLTSVRESESTPYDADADHSGPEFPSSLIYELQSPSQLKITERALRLNRDGKQEEADALLSENGLRWQRKKDFWVLSGGPLTDTASISGIRLPEYQFIDMPGTLGVEAPSSSNADKTSSSHIHTQIRKSPTLSLK